MSSPLFLSTRRIAAGRPAIRPPRAEEAFVLPIVLLCVVLLVVLVIAYLGAVTTDQAASNSYSRSAESRSLANTAVNLVIAQLQQATQSTDSHGAAQTWCSQPGLIRTFSATGAVNNANYSYKLYSADDLVHPGALKPTEDTPDPSWATNPALYTDLNAPVTRSVNGTAKKIYPILNPPDILPNGSTPDASKAQVVGFNYLTDTKVNPYSVTDPVMPVKWLYVLKNGEIVVPTGTGKIATVAGATKANPVTGRIAFWTDDETCKINLNTAAGDAWGSNTPGAFWDLPRLKSIEENNLGDDQPRIREYQRFPGHPATVYLGAAFPSLSRTDLFTLAPRIQSGGSEGGTVAGLPTSVGINLDGDRLYTSVDELLFSTVFDANRNRVPEGMLSANKVERRKFFLTAHSRSPEVNLFGLPRVAMWPISYHFPLNDAFVQTHTTPFDRTIAFCSTLKTASTSPSAFYLQRKESSDPTTDFSLGRNSLLYSYLQNLTARPVPGFGGKFSEKYAAASGGSTDRDQILTEAFDYIRCTNIFDEYAIKQNKASYPTGGYPTGTFTYTAQKEDTTRYDPGHGQVAPLIPGNGTKGFGRFSTISEAGMIFICTADGDTDDQTERLTLCRTSNTTANKTLGGTKLNEAERRIEAMFIMELFTPSQGYPLLSDDMQIRVSGLQNFEVDNVPLGMPATGTIKMRGVGNNVFHGRGWGGNGGIRLMIAGDKDTYPDAANEDPGHPDNAAGNVNRRRLPRRGVMPEDAGWTSDNGYPFISVPITIAYATPQDVTKNKASDVKTTMYFKGGDITVEIFAGRNTNLATATKIQTLHINLPSATFPVPKLVNDTGSLTATQAKNLTIQPGTWWTFSRDGVGITTSNGTLDKGRLYFVEKDPGDASSGAGAGAIFREEDVVRTVRPSHGDYRLVAGQQDVWKDATGKDVFIKHDKYDDTSVMQAHAIREGSKGDIFVKYESGGTFVRGVTYYKEITPDVPTNITDSSVTNIMQTGDWDTGFATVNDGPYINFPDAAGLYNDNLNDGAGAAFFSPNHQVSSAGMFGSLPTRVKAGVPYQTLLFRPSTSGHPAVSDTIPDHLFMDLFWMPIVEPYAISEPFSTAGKINMNYQIVPFTYIERSTALQAAMQAERVLGIPTTVSTTYKNRDDLKNILRNKISAGASSENASGTLSQFMQRFASSDKGYAFKSATEICDLHLVPEGYNVGTMSSFWVTNALTGDNVRERPYANLYQKLTTKSNTFTVHYRVQALQQSNNDPQPTQWREGRDVVTSEYRGSTIIERFISPDTVLPDFADPTTTGTLDSYYKWHIVNAKRFDP